MELKGTLINNEIYKIKKYYCSKCIYFINYKCQKNKMIKRCFKKNAINLNEDEK